jgi:hypothetical protein
MRMDGSKSNGGAHAQQSCRVDKAPPHKNDSKLADSSLNWILCNLSQLQSSGVFESNQDVAESGEPSFRLRRSQDMIVPVDLKHAILAAEMRFCS